MPRRRAGSRRKRIEWAWRLAFATLIVVVACCVITFSLAQVLYRQDAAAAVRLAPYDGRITAQRAITLAGTQATPADRLRADVLARRALRQDPTAIAAVAALGLDAEVRGDVSSSRRLFTYAQRLSRRDLATQLWSIEDAVRRGDVADALHQYDIALRTKVESADLLFPVLASAATDPAIRTALLRTLAARPLWGERYVDYVAASGIEPKSTAALLDGLRRFGIAVSPAAETNVINALLSSGSYDLAWAQYATIRQGVDRRRSRRLPATGIQVPSRLDWMAVDGDGITATIRGGVIDFSAAASVGGPLVRQEQLLPPGLYRFSGHGTGIDQANGFQPYWALACQNGRELGRVVVPNSNSAQGGFGGSFTVPADCPLQVLTLVALPSDALAGSSGQIDRITLSSSSAG